MKNYNVIIENIIIFLIKDRSLLYSVFHFQNKFKKIVLKIEIVCFF